MHRAPSAAATLGAALGLAVGLTVGPSTVPAATSAVPASSVAAVAPEPGSYEGADIRGQWVTFSVAHGVVHDLRTAHGRIDVVHVDADGRWQRTCNRYICVRGHFTSPTHAQGYWRDEETDWVAWSMDSTDGGIVPASGQYVGALHQDREARVEFRFGHGAVRHFSGPAHVALAPVDQEVPSFQHCGETRCVQGHWVTPYWVEGVWRRVHEETWHHWFAGFVAEPDESHRPSG